VSCLVRKLSDSTIRNVRVVVVVSLGWVNGMFLHKVFNFDGF
jgi:hypothetical protein